MNTDAFWGAGNMLALHYEQGGSPEDTMGRKLLLAFGAAILQMPEAKEIADKYGISFDEVCMICETSWSLMPNPCLRWRKSIDGYRDEDARMIASTALFLEPERFERIAIEVSKQSVAGMQRVMTLSDIARRELQVVASDYNRQFGIPAFERQDNGGFKAQSSGCLPLLIGVAVIGVALQATRYL